MTGVTVRAYPDARPDEKEILRYARAGGDSLPPEALECLRAFEGSVCGRVVYAYYPLRRSGEKLLLGFTEIRSKDLAKNLADSDGVVLFCATAGPEFDRAVRRYERISPARALWCQAIGAAWAESVCDAFCADLRREYGAVRPRFSPGYGDLPLTVQTDIFAALEPQRHIGVTLNESLFMTPTKSVTAVVGVKERTE